MKCKIRGNPVFGIIVWPSESVHSMDGVESDHESIGSMTEEQAQAAVSDEDYDWIRKYCVVDADLSPEQWTRYPTNNN